MKKKPTLPDILSNAFNKDYTADKAVADLGKLINRATLIKIQHGTDSPRFTELQRLVPVQERLAETKLDGHPIFEQLSNLNIATHKDN